ncbi:hypothetical protein [Spirosoma sp.]|uniref:hypothetical protein n=1 Tax=Spirosoma sp. TaxID=1899569 RepID=UPI003B3BA429
MKKLIAIVLILGVVLFPVAFRLIFPHFYQVILESYPIVGVGLLLLLDILWMWVALLFLSLLSRFARWMRTRR